MPFLPGAALGFLVWGGPILRVVEESPPQAKIFFEWYVSVLFSELVWI
jgi:hypothetical protein